METVPERSWEAEYQQQLQLLVECIQDYAIFLLDTEGRVMTWTKSAERIKGYNFEEIRGRHFSVFYPPEDIERGKPDYELKVAAEEGRFEDEGWRIRKDGSRFWANVVITALKDDKGVLYGFGKVTRDITQLKWAMEVTFEKLFRSSPNPVVLSSLDDGRFIEVNEALCELLGYSREELIGQRSITLGIWVNPEERIGIVSELRAGRSVREEPCEMRTKSGEKRIINLSADIIEFRGHPCLFATLLDTTESRKLEAVIEELSTPVLQAQEGLLVLPLIGRVDGPRATQLRNQLLNAVHTNRARAAVIDLTGVPKIESETADGLIRTIEAVQLLGAKVILAGISAIIADTFVGIGARFSRIKTTADLQSALEEAKNLLSAESSPT
jgi:PAS domain S-box-containing protein